MILCTGWKSMFTLSAFADEIDPDPLRQIKVLKSCGIRYVELRSIHNTNVLELSQVQVRELKELVDSEGFGLSAIGSPIGKVAIEEPFQPHLDRFHRAIDLAHFFQTPNIRIFSYYLPKGADHGRWREEVIRRMLEKVELAKQAQVRLLHENEHGIFGDAPERVRDLIDSADSSTLRAVYDAANYVVCGYDPWQAWETTRELTIHLHIKDWRHGDAHGCLAGEGDGELAAVIADAVKRGYDGFATLEPHLIQGGPTGGVTGPELFPKAVAAFKRLLDHAGGTYR
jgi:sugar phosphate isomerase/epimerase